MPSTEHPSTPRGPALRAIQTRLLNWFDKSRRDLPWRASRDPYRIWVSEVMLQQTTVSAVIPYFERFLTTFPTVEALAEADEQQVLRLWEGLGYYRRARHLHAAARALVASPGSTLPDDPTVWEELPGVGRYILGAVLSQAFDRRLPIVEANSLRVISRLLGFRGDPREGEGKKWVWTAAESLLPNQRVGDFNQALMELGALVCLPKAPECSNCPVAAACQARKGQLQEQIPPPPQSREVTQVQEVGVIIRRGEHVLLCRRREDAGRWQNMWEVPHAPVIAEEALRVAAVRVAKDLTGLDVEPGDELMTVRHAVTRYRITLTGIETSAANGEFIPGFYAAGEWLKLSELDRHPVSSPQRKLITNLSKSKRTRRLF